MNLDNIKKIDTFFLIT